MFHSQSISFSQFLTCSRGGWCCWSKDHTLRTTGAGGQHPYVANWKGANMSTTYDFEEFLLEICFIKSRWFKHLSINCLLKWMLLVADSPKKPFLASRHASPSQLDVATLSLG